MTETTPTLAFDAFWSWLITHPNCILRAGTQDAVIYDDDDLHWHFATEGPDTLLIQLVRGKRLMSEIFLGREQITYVQTTPGEEDGEFLFELISEGEAERVVRFFFVLSHAYDGQDEAALHRVH